MISLMKQKSINLLMTRMCSQLNQVKVNIPQKCLKFPELTEQFLAQRQNHNNNNEELNIEPFKELIVDKDSENAIKEVIEHYNKIRLKTPYYPSVITVEDMNYMLTKLHDSSRRKRHLNFLFVREFDIWRNEKYNNEMSAHRREKRRLEKLNFGQIGCFDAQNQLQYGYWKNTLFSRYYEQSIHKYSLNRLRTASLFGQKIVIDCSFDNEMEEHEALSAGRQMARIYSINRHQSKDPFDLHYCGCPQNGRVLKNFEKQLSNCDFNKHFINVHHESYSELFPNEKLVYLTPDAKPILTQFDHNAVYIMGSLIGKSCRLPLTAIKARRQGLEHYRLPIHLFVELAPQVKKVLSFQAVFKSLLEVKSHGDWKLAFTRAIQQHKLKTTDFQDEQSVQLH